MNQLTLGSSLKAFRIARKDLHIHLCWFVLACACSCSNSNTLTQPILTGNLSGHIYLVDSTFSQISSGGVTVSLAEIQRSTKTDSSGSWTMSNIQIGNYEVIATKPGFGTMKWFQEQVLGPGTLYINPTYIYQAPSCTLFLDSVTSNGLINFFGRIEGFKSVLYIQFDVDSDSTTEPGEPHLIGTAANNGKEIQDEGQWNFQVNKSAFGTLQSGTKVFLSVYAYPYNSNDYTMYDPVSQQFLPVSPSKKSNSILFTVP